MTLTRIKLERFTAFETLDVRFSPGVNLFIGANGTGKTHVLKAAYAACDVSKRPDDTLASKLVRTFRPYEERLGRLAHRTTGSTKATVDVDRGNEKLRISFTNHTKGPEQAKSAGLVAWRTTPIESAYIPVKEMLANAPGFRSLYATRDIHFEEIYADIVDRAYRPALRGPHDALRKKLLGIVQKVVDGKVTTKGETFFLKNKGGDLEFTLLAEGMRKLALLWLLIQNGTLLEGSVLFWDEPEANLNPKVMRVLVEILLELQRGGVQIFIATHDYVLLKEFDLQRKPGDAVTFHGLHRDEGGVVRHQSAGALEGLDQNASRDTFSDLYAREIRRSLGS